MQLSSEERRVLDTLAERGPEIIDRAIGWCAVSSGSRNLVGLERQRALLEDALSALPGEVEPASPRSRR